MFWRLKSQPGRPPIPKQVQALIRRTGSENPIWGEERIASELLLELGIQISPRAVRKDVFPVIPPPAGLEATCGSRPLLRLHGHGIVARDFMVAVTAAPPESEHDPRKSHRLDSARVLGLANPHGRIAFAVHSEILDS
ncbi:MAG TPA: helix-turn-helix domain-containing protein [Steroidobacteraceae bacterium]|nr:helix-turn-helix domain-containing protein [Steroidobacteraceae bacterium]